MVLLDRKVDENALTLDFSVLAYINTLAGSGLIKYVHTRGSTKAPVFDDF